MTKVKKSKWNIDKVNKIYHISDVHVRNYKRHPEYKRVFETLYSELKNRVTDKDIICLTGDIVHSKTDVSPELFQEVQEFLNALCEIGHVLMIPGNHDTNLNNSNRMDALTPIVNAINKDNLDYFKDSGILQIGDCKFYHWSVFDSIQKYPKLKVEPEYKHIALYHGLVNNTRTESGYVLHSESMKLDNFEGFDMVLLGDIHKTQYLNEEKTIAYPGSLIQQNHGEDLIHGILIWNISDFSSEFLTIPNDTAFYTIEVDSGVYKPIPNEIPSNLYLRIKYKNTDHNVVKSIVNELRKEKNIVELSYQRIYDSVKRENNINTVRGIDFRSVDKQRELLYTYLKSKYSLDDDAIAKIYEINDVTNRELAKRDVPRNTMWLPKKFEFENMFSYGKGNCIDFSNMEGTYGIFAPNASGKSALLDAITYCIFDKCTKSNRGHQVMNSNSNTFYCRLQFELNGIDYVIERNAKRQKNGNVRVEVDFYHFDDSGNKISLNGKERSDTNNNIKNLLGSHEDFVLTTMSTQSNNTGFIDMNQKDRKDLLSQFLDIGVFEELYEIANESSKEMVAVMKHHQKNNYELDITQKDMAISKIELDIDQCDAIVQNTKLNVRTLNEKRVTLAQGLQEIDASIVDEEVLLSKKAEANDLLSKTLIEIKQVNEKASNIESECVTVNAQIDSINEKQLQLKISEVKKLNELKSEKDKQIRDLQNHLFHKNKKMENLKELEYDPNCEYCMNNVFVKDAINTKNEIEKDTEQFEEAKIQYQILLNKIDSYGDLENESKTLVELKNQSNDLTRTKLELDKKVLVLQENVKKIKYGIEKIEDKLNSRKKQLEAIESNKKIQEASDKLIQSITSLEEELSVSEKELTRLERVKITLQSEKNELEKNLKELKLFKNNFKHHQYYLEAIHRDGIPHDLISTTIPQIEEEVNNILSQLVDFRVILQTDEKHVNAYIAYDENKFWPIELTSGMEKFISSLAIRTSLINISTLPRPNFMAIDEGFGALDKSNLSSMAMLFDYLKTQFRFIMIISHIDSMRDIVDSHIEINKVDGRSNIKHK